MAEETGKKYSDRAIERLWELILHEDNMFCNRSNYFLLSMSVLLVAITSFPARDDSIILILGITGMALIFLWMSVAMRSIYLTMNPIKKVLRENLAEYDIIVEGRKRYPATNKVMGMYLPLIMLVMWAGVLFVLL